MQEHTLTLNSTLKVTGIKKVDSYTKSKIILKLEKQYLVIEGENLDLFRIDITGGIIEASGTISGLRYQTSTLNKGFVKKLLK